MGFFKRTKYSPSELRVIEEHTRALTIAMGFSPRIARTQAEGLMDASIAQTQRGGIYDLPLNLGDIILGNAPPNSSTVTRLVESIRSDLVQARQDGVRDDDVQWWWNRSSVEREFLIMQDNVARLALYSYVMDENKRLPREHAKQMAVRAVFKTHPTFGRPDDTVIGTGDDKGLPLELKDRINRYIQMRARGSQEAYKRDMDDATSFNALVRREIRAGNI